ncbi:LpxL/LpxP family Kdo(2)-lipid IV(A) lauroyl/palmitoleoyl acyltransferase [Endothiovibrio diazotrophicus]
MADAAPEPIRLRHRPAWLAVGLVRLLAALPFPLWRPAGTLIGRAIEHAGRRRRHIAETNLRLCLPQLSDTERKRLVSDHFRSLGLSVVEMAAAWCAPEKRLRERFEVVGMEHLEAARRDGRGVLLMSAHLVYLEMGARGIATFAPVHPMYRRHGNPILERFIAAARGRHMAEPVERGDVRKLVRLLKGGGIVWYAPDQNYGAEHSIFVPFFGVEAATITSTSRLARMGNARVMPFFPERLIDGRYRLQLLPALEGFPSGDDTADTRRINRLIEERIRRTPADYLWIHRRFKTRPPGSPSVY